MLTDAIDAVAVLMPYHSPDLMELRKRRDVALARHAAEVEDALAARFDGAPASNASLPLGTTGLVVAFEPTHCPDTSDRRVRWRVG